MSDSPSTQSGSDCYCGWFNPTTGESGTFQSDCKTPVKNPWYHFLTKAWARWEARQSWRRQQKEHEARVAALQASYEADLKRRAEEAWTYHTTVRLTYNWYSAGMFSPTRTWQTQEVHSIYYNHLLKQARLENGTKIDYHALCKDGNVVPL